jgi:hypothetical protein
MLLSVLRSLPERAHLCSLVPLSFKRIQNQQKIIFYLVAFAVFIVLFLLDIPFLLSGAADTSGRCDGVKPIDLVLIDQRSVGKRCLDLIDTVNAEKSWTAIYWRVNKFLKESHIVTR